MAAVVSFWPDHLELHGSLDRYRAAKETIVRHQRPGDRVVVNADDASAGFAAADTGRRLGVLARPPGRPRAFLDAERGIVLSDGDRDGARAHRGGTAHPGNLVAAAAIAAAAGASRRHRGRVSMACAPPWRAQPSGTLAASPSSTTAWPRPPEGRRDARPLSASSVVLVAGGLTDAGGGSCTPLRSRWRSSSGLRRDRPRRPRRRALRGGGPRLARSSRDVGSSRSRPPISRRRSRRPPAIPPARRRSSSHRSSRSRSTTAPVRRPRADTTLTGVTSHRRRGVLATAVEVRMTYFFNSQNPSTAKNSRLNISGLLALLNRLPDRP